MIQKRESITVLLNDASDCDWLRDTHLKDYRETSAVRRFRSFELWGNEDCPDRVELYEFREPYVTDEPLAVFTFNPEAHALRPSEV